MVDPEGYEFLDAGDGARLERFGSVVGARPSPAATMPRADPAAWDAATLTFDRMAGWAGAAQLPDDWSVELAGVRLLLRPTEAGQVGVFPEHATLLPWLEQRSAAGREILHLFAFTGLVTLALARTGAAVTHVDAARPAVAWARDNAALNGLADHPIRWLVEDAGRYVEREARRGRRYDGVVLDPPTYGHGAAGGRAWRLERDLPALLDRIAALVRPTGWVQLTAHATGLRPKDLATMLRAAMPATGRTTSGRVRLSARSGSALDLGAVARWEGSR